MRTKSIVSIIKKYGLSSKRLNPKNRIKYEDAVKSIKGYESAELEITDIIDNVLYPEKSISKVCQVDGCGKKIRYEYVLKNKATHDILVAGSTCVWVLLGLDELQIKNFGKMEQAIKDYHALLLWKEANPDVVAKLQSLKENDLYSYKPFWTEIECCKLLDEDTEYIRNLDVDTLIRRKQERMEAKQRALSMTTEQRVEADREYQKVLTGLQKLVEANPNNEFYNSLMRQVKRGVHLSDRQVKCIKSGVNKLWYDTKVKGTSYDCWKTCDSYVYNTLKSNVDTLPKRDTDKYVSSNLKFVEDLFLGMTDKASKLIWTVYKVKHSLVLN